MPTKINDYGQGLYHFYILDYVHQHQHNIFPSSQHSVLTLYVDIKSIVDIHNHTTACFLSLSRHHLLDYQLTPCYRTRILMAIFHVLWWNSSTFTSHLHASTINLFLIFSLSFFFPFIIQVQGNKAQFSSL